MLNKMNVLLLLMLTVSITACAGKTLHEDYGKSVTHNKIMQTVDLQAAKEIQPDVKMDGQKAAKVVENYRKEAPQADMEDLTK